MRFPRQERAHLRPEMAPVWVVRARRACITSRHPPPRVLVLFFPLLGKCTPPTLGHPRPRVSSKRPFCNRSLADIWTQWAGESTSSRPMHLPGSLLTTAADSSSKASWYLLPTRGLSRSTGSAWTLSTRQSHVMAHSKPDSASDATDAIRRRSTRCVAQIC